MLPISPIPLETATKENLVKLLSERLYPDQLTLMAKVDLLSNERRQQAITSIEDCIAYETELNQLSALALMELAEDEFDQDKEVQKEKSEQEDNNRFFTTGHPKPIMESGLAESSGRLTKRQPSCSAKTPMSSIGRP